MLLVLLLLQAATQEAMTASPIPDLSELPQDVYCIHAGTEKTADGYVSNGSRVLFIGSVHHNRTDAVESVKTGLHIFKDNPNFHYRTDIQLGK